MRESSPPDAARAIGANGQARVRPDRKRHLVGARRAGFALGELDREFSFSEPECSELVAGRLRKRLCCGTACTSELLRKRSVDRFERRQVGLGTGQGIAALFERCKLLACLRGPLNEFGGRVGPEPSLRVADPLECVLDDLEAAGLRLERVDECPQPRRGVAQTAREVRQLG